MISKERLDVHAWSESLRDYKPLPFQATQFALLTVQAENTDFQAAEWVAMPSEERKIDPLFEVFDQPASDDTKSEENFAEAVQGDVEDDVQEGVQIEPPEGSKIDQPVIEVAPVEVISQEVLDLREIIERMEQEKLEMINEHSRLLEVTREQVESQVREAVQAESNQRLEVIEGRYATIVEDLNQQIKEGIEGVERRAVELSINVAKKLVGTIVEIHPEYVLTVIKQAVQLTGGANIKAIKVGPRDLEFLQKLAPDRQFKELDGTWSFQGDESIRAGCIVETHAGEVEFDLDKAWERVRDSVVKVR